MPHLDCPLEPLPAKEVGLEQESEKQAVSNRERFFDNEEDEGRQGNRGR